MTAGASTTLYLGIAVMLHRSEEHTSELQSHSDLVCRLLLEKKKGKHYARVKESSTIFSVTIVQQS